MRRLVKILVWVFVALFLILGIVPKLFEGKIQTIVKQEANKMLEARLDFEDLDLGLLSHFPNASLDLEGLTLVGVGEFEGDTIVAADRISVVVNLLSLFGDEGFEVGKVILDAPQIHAHKLASGRVNWDVMKASEEAENQTEEVENQVEEPSQFKLSLKNFRIDDAVIRFEDDSSRMAFSTKPLCLDLRGDLSAQKSALDLDLGLEQVNVKMQGMPLMVDADLSLEARIQADLEKKHFAFQENKLLVNDIEMMLDGWVEMAENAIKMDLKAGCNQVKFKDVVSLIPAFYTNDFRNLSAHGELSLSLWAKGEMAGRNLPEFELNTAVKDGSLRYSSLPSSVDNIQLALKVSNPGREMDKTIVDLQKFGFSFGANHLSTRLRATNLASDPQVDFALDCALDLDHLKDVYPLDKEMEVGGKITADVDFSGALSSIEKQRYQQLKARGSFLLEKVGVTLPSLPKVEVQRLAATITPLSMTLGDCLLKLGRSDLEANGELKGYLGFLMNGSELGGRLYVKSSLLDLNEWISMAQPAENEAKIETEETSETAETETMGVFHLPKNMNLSLSTHLQKILLQKMQLTDIKGEMRLKNGVLSLNGLNVGVFGGKASASGYYSTVETPRLSLNASLSEASFQRTFEELELIQQLVPVFQKTGGDYSLKMNLATDLDEQMSPVMQTLNASGEISSKNIEVQELKVFSQLATLLKNDQFNKLQARDVSIKFAVKDGRITTQPFDLKLAGVNINLSGSTGLDQTIDYVAKVSLAGKTGGVLSSVPVKIGGTFSKPDLKLGVKEAAEEALKQGVAEKLGEKLGLKSDNPLLPQKDTAAIRERAKKNAQKLVDEAEAQRQRLVEGAKDKSRLAQIAAEKAGDKLVEEAQRQADKILQRSEEQIAKH